MTIITCPHCGKELSVEEAKRIATQYFGSRTSSKKRKSSAENVRKAIKARAENLARRKAEAAADKPE